MPIDTDTAERAEVVGAEQDPPNQHDTALPPSGDNANAADEGIDRDRESPRATRRRRLALAPHRLALVVSAVLVVALAALAGSLGWRIEQTHRTASVREQMVQAGRQGALNLTTIDWQHADRDVQRILDSATGTFHDDFAKRSQPFIEVVKQAKSTSQGTITAAGLESVSGDDGQVLAAVNVKITNAGAQEQKPRSWRMRISVQKVGDEMKVSNVEFVP